MRLANWATFPMRLMGVDFEDEVFQLVQESVSIQASSQRRFGLIKNGGLKLG